VGRAFEDPFSTRFASNSKNLVPFGGRDLVNQTGGRTLRKYFNGRGSRAFALLGGVGFTAILVASCGGGDTTPTAHKTDDTYQAPTPTVPAPTTAPPTAPAPPKPQAPPPAPDNGLPAGWTTRASDWTTGGCHDLTAVLYQGDWQFTVGKCEGNSDGDNKGNVVYHDKATHMWMMLDADTPTMWFGDEVPQGEDVAWLRPDEYFPTQTPAETQQVAETAQAAPDLVPTPPLPPQVPKNARTNLYNEFISHFDGGAKAANLVLCSPADPAPTSKCLGGGFNMGPYSPSNGAALGFG
jgi:hypothetical protein